MGGCCSKDLDDKRSWSPDETKNGSTTSTIIAQPLDDVGSTGVFTMTRTTTTTTTTQQQQHKTVSSTDQNLEE
ncbi:uncharacterized protein Dwil_GK16451 [Drosophila willistoni]|uniref:Uncharacterized protein n=1 Tax=Drosophila willistoni TaxID=7260 RepID=B4N285_DROWI|nr:uncharacterized protein LOC6644530 [Drosophila willistoni]EDW78474.1 uncharacterized protein Dwil_GK16451 [Drosophila willistoni]